MKKSLIIAPILLLLLFFAAESSYACSCLLPNGSISLEKQVEASFKDASAVFSAEVIEVDQLPNDPYVTVKLKVNKSWKGITTKEIVLTTGKGGGDCGYRFEVAQKYLIYSYKGENNVLGTGICSRTSLVKDNKDIKILNKLKRKKT